jgi:hypothetical protein
VRVPDQAANGIAKATLSFPSWKAVNIAPTKFDVNVSGSKPGTTGGATSPAKQ